MSPEHTAALFEAGPTLYRDRSKGPRETLICFGFECGDGWFDLLLDLTHKLEAEIKKMRDSVDSIEFLPRASQVKEKFGTLRFYLDGHETPDIIKAIDIAEDRSSKTCDVCGRHGRVQNVNLDASSRFAWFAARCDKHVTEPDDE